MFKIVQEKVINIDHLLHYLSRCQYQQRVQLIQEAYFEVGNLFGDALEKDSVGHLIKFFSVVQVAHEIVVHLLSVNIIAQRYVLSVEVYHEGS